MPEAAKEGKNLLNDIDGSMWEGCLHIIAKHKRDYEDAVQNAEYPQKVLKAQRDFFRVLDADVPKPRDEGNNNGNAPVDSTIAKIPEDLEDADWMGRHPAL